MGCQCFQSTPGCLEGGVHEVQGLLGHPWALGRCLQAAKAPEAPMGAGEHLWDTRASTTPYGFWGGLYGMQGAVRAPMGAGGHLWDAGVWQRTCAYWGVSLGCKD